MNLENVVHWGRNLDEYIEGKEELRYKHEELPRLSFKILYLATQEQQEKWKISRIRNWPEI